MNLRIGVLVFILVNTGSIFAENIILHVINRETKEPIPFVNVINLRTSRGVISDKKGIVSIEAQLNDSLSFSSIGYLSSIHVIAFNDKLVIELEPTSYLVQEVDVLVNEELPLIYKSEIFPNDEPNIVNAIFQPISFLYYKMSKKEKEKRKIRGVVEYEKKMRKIHTIYNKELVAEFTGLYGTELDSCFVFCNANIKLSEYDTSFTIKFKLLEILSKYNQK